MARKSDTLAEDKPEHAVHEGTDHGLRHGIGVGVKDENFCKKANAISQGSGKRHWEGDEGGKGERGRGRPGHEVHKEVAMFCGWTLVVSDGDLPLSTIPANQPANQRNNQALRKRSNPPVVSPERKQSPSQMSSVLQRVHH